MNFDIGYITEIAKQFLGAIFAVFQVSTSNGQSMLKIVDFFGALGDLFVRAIQAIGALFGGLGG